MQRTNLTIKKEVEILRELGIPEYQIGYLIREKYKNVLRNKLR